VGVREKLGEEKAVVYAVGRRYEVSAYEVGV